MKRLMTIMTALVVASAMCFTAIGEFSFASEQQAIGADKAKSIALSNAKLSTGKVRGMECDYDDEDGVYEIEFTKKKNRAEYDYEIHAFSGKILKKCVDYKYKAKRSNKKIGKKKAIKKVAKYSKISAKTIKKGTCKFKYKKRGSKYEIKFRKGDYKYEAEVLARNGKVIEWEYEYIGR